MCIFDINCQWPEPLYCTNLIQPTAPDDAGKGECSYQCNFIVFKLKNKKSVSMDYCNITATYEHVSKFIAI